MPGLKADKSLTVCLNALILPAAYFFFAGVRISPDFILSITDSIFFINPVAFLGRNSRSSFSRSISVERSIEAMRWSAAVACMNFTIISAFFVNLPGSEDSPE